MTKVLERNPTDSIGQLISKDVFSFGENHCLVIKRQFWGNKDILDVRHFYKSKTLGKFIPTKKGIGLPVETWPEVIALIQKNLDDGKRINFE